MERSASIDFGAGTRLLLRLWKDPVEAGDCANGEEDWQSFLAVCDYHRISSVAFNRFQNCGRRIVPAYVLDQLRARFYHVSAYNYRLALHLVELISQFKSEQIPALALKGPAVAMAAYGDLSLREYEDIDLLIPVAKLSEAAAMMTGRGFRLAAGHAQRQKNVRRNHEITLEAPDKSYNVDLHWQLSPPYARIFGPDVSGLWARAVKLHLPHGDVPALCREDLFLTLCQHGTRHRWWQLKWVFDVAELLRSAEPMDWRGIEALVKTRPMAREAASLGVMLARELMGVRLPAEAEPVLQPARRTCAVARAIRDEFLSRGQTNGSAHDTLVGLEQRPLVRARYEAVEAVRYPVRTILFTISVAARKILTIVR